MGNLTSTQGPEDEKPLAIVRASDLEKSGSHVTIACQIIEAVQPFLRKHAEIGGTIEIPKAAEEEALKTFELANLRLRNILDEEGTGRWSMEPTGAEKASSAVLETYRLKAEAQTALVNALLAPHKRLNAKIRKYPTTGWVAWVGGEHPLTTDLNGVGNSPAQAFDAFDRNYREQIALIPKLNAPPPEAPAKSPRKRPKP